MVLTISRCRALLAAALGLSAGLASAADLPPVMQALQGRGLEAVQEFDAGEGLRGFAALAGDAPVAIYVTPAGTAIVGTRLDADGQARDQDVLDTLISLPMAEKSWAQLAESAWVLDGKADAPVIVYTFSDPNCPYCNRFWHQIRPWVDAGKVQLRHVLVGVIRADSPHKAAAILEAKDPSKALLENESQFAAGGIKPAASVSEGAAEKLNANQALMASLGFRGTPGIVLRDTDGLLQKFNGLPQPEALIQVLGPL